MSNEATMPQDISDREDFTRIRQINTKICLGINRFVNFCHLVIIKTRRQQHLLVAITKADGTIFIKNT